MNRYLLLIVTVLVMAMLSTACSQPINQTTSQNFSENKIQVAVSILPQADFVEKIGQEKVQVTVMIPPGASPATYEPTPSQLKYLSWANLYIKIGHIPFEKTWMNKITDANKNMQLIDSSQDIEIIENDPHIWLSPSLVKIQAEHIYNGLVGIDPKNKDYYTENKNKFLQDLDALDKEIKVALSDIAIRKFMIFHPSWGYFAKDYGLEQIPIEIEGKEPNPDDIVKLIETAKANNIQIIFASPQFSTRNAELIAKEIGGKVIFVDPLARDYITNMSIVSKTFAQVPK